MTSPNNDFPKQTFYDEKLTELVIEDTNIIFFDHLDIRVRISFNAGILPNQYFKIKTRLVFVDINIYFNLMVKEHKFDHICHC